MFSDFYFESSKLNLHCESIGDTDAPSSVIFIHGLASNATRWHELMGLSDLKQDSHLLAIDLRGHGKSMCFCHYTRHDWVADVCRLLTNKNVPSILIGHSLGAQVALETALQKQAKNLKAMVLIDPVFPVALTGKLKTVARFRVLFKLFSWLLLGWHWLGFNKRNYPYRNLRKLDEQTRKFLAENPDRGIADLYMDPFADLEFMPLVNYVQDLYEVTRPLPDISGITCPVLTLLSAGASTSQLEINKQILSRIPQLEIQNIDADHWLLTEKPVEAREIIQRWCKQQLK